MTLQALGITKRFDGLTAVSSVSFTLPRGRLVSLVGPNGAGKTTCFNLLTGFIPVTSGRILIDGQDATALKPHRWVRRGVTRTFQMTSLFGKLSAVQNVQVSLSRRHYLSPLQILSPFGRHPGLEERAMALLETVGVAHRARVRADSMAYGDQRRLAVAVALGTDPKYLLLDEPAAGLNATESGALGELLRRLVDDGLGVLLVEHDMRLVMRVSDHIHVLSAGRTLVEGTADEVRAHPDVVAAYLGRSNA